MTNVVRGRISEKLDRGRAGSDMNHAALRGSSGPEQIKDLYGCMERYHLEFLSLEGNRKLESLRLLKAYAAEFLSQVSHPHKFKVAATEAVLSQSIGLVPGVDPRETSVAFEDLAKYANNLLQQPWRKEFHRLKTTSGFFMHSIRAKLSNPQEILILLGYVATDDYTMELAFKPDPTCLVAVSRDCYIASQECLILSQILDRVRTEMPEYPLTIQEVYAARKLLIGDTTTIVKHLIHQIRIRIGGTETRENPANPGTSQERSHHRSRRSESQPYHDYSQAMNHNHHTFPALDHFIDTPDGQQLPKLYSNVKVNGSKSSSSSKQLTSIGSINTSNQIHLQQSEASTSGSNRVSSNSTSRSSSSPRSPNSCNSLKELEDVFIQSYLESKGQAPRQSGQTPRQSDSNSSEVSDLLDRHQHHVSQVDSIRQQRTSQSSSSQPKQRGRRSELGTQSTRVAPASSDFSAIQSDALYDVVDGRRGVSSRSSRASTSSTSGFKSLKHHQDLPKSAVSNSNLAPNSNLPPNCTSNGGILGKIKVSLGGKSVKQEKSDPEKEQPKFAALTRSKVPIDFDQDKLGYQDRSRIYIQDKSGIVDKNDKNQLGSSSSDERIHQTEDRSSPVLPNPQNLGISGSSSHRTSVSSPELAGSLVKWQCPHCTYVNTSTLNICEMCAKSKDFVLEDTEDTWQAELS